MSDGLTHERFATAGLVALAASCVVANQLYDFPPEIYYAIPGGLLAFLIDSDMMDEHQITTRGENRLYKLFWIPGFIIECYSYPLAKILVHRSIYSHLPGLCSTVRLLYYLFPVLYLLYGYEIFITLYEQYTLACIYFFIGGVLIDSIHATLDKWNFVW